MAQETFQRYEKKYLLTPEQYHNILPDMQNYLAPDAYGKYTISNIYYDTRDYYLIRTSLDKPYYKEKLRLRSYITPDADDKVFLEIKKKCAGIVYKRRAEMTLRESADYLLKGIRPDANNQILNELDYFLEHYPLEPKVFLAYERKAFAGIYDPELRVTFDTAIRFRENNLSLSSGNNGTLLFASGLVLMEVKLPGVMPYWMAKLFAKNKIYPVSFSKYGTFYQQKLLKAQKGVHNYA